MEERKPIVIENEKVEEALSAINEKSLIPGRIDAEEEKKVQESLIDSEANLDKIKAPRFQRRGSNFTPGRPKNFLKARKKKNKQQKQSRKNNRKK